jgi:hypothetical protein
MKLKTANRAWSRLVQLCRGRTPRQMGAVRDQLRQPRRPDGDTADVINRLVDDYAHEHNVQNEPLA